MRSQRRNHKGLLNILWGLVFPVLLIAGVVSPEWALGEEETEGKVLRTQRYYYKAFNRRDPFRSLIRGEFEESEQDLVNIYSVRLVGILSGGVDRYAMLEDNNGFGYILKSGDPIRHGNVVSVGDRSLVARVSMFGQTNSVTLRLEGNKGKGE